MLIGIMGKRGSYSEKAGRTFIAQQNGKYADAELCYLVSAEAVLSALEQGTVDVGVVAFENSNGGFVMETLDALCAHNCRRIDIVEVNVHHNLLAMPGVTENEVEDIVSHVQALLQCDQYLKRIWRRIIPRPYADTAQAAEDLAAGRLPRTTAVIASLEAANIHGLEILDRSIEDRKFNVTNFLVAERC